MRVQAAVPGVHAGLLPLRPLQDLPRPAPAAARPRAGGRGHLHPLHHLRGVVGHHYHVMSHLVMSYHDCHVMSPGTYTSTPTPCTCPRPGSAPPSPPPPSTRACSPSPRASPATSWRRTSGSAPWPPSWRPCPCWGCAASCWPPPGRRTLGTGAAPCLGAGGRGYR